jgi:hypothetical protein
MYNITDSKSKKDSLYSKRTNNDLQKLSIEQQESHKKSGGGGMEVWTRLILHGNQILLHMWHSSCLYKHIYSW